MGWTGGQYSLWRTALGVAIALESIATMRSASSMTEALLASSSLALAVALALGWRDKLAAFLLLPLLGRIEASLGGLRLTPSFMGPLGVSESWLLLSLMLVPFMVPPAPFGSLDARDRTDPRGDWRWPGWLTDYAWVLLLFVFVARVGRSDAPLDFLGLSIVGSLELCTTFIGLVARRFRGSLWIALVLLCLADTSAFGMDHASMAHLLLLLVAAQPGWWRGRSLRSRANAMSRGGASSTPAHLFYDGDCGFCHRSVRFILSEELATPEPLRLRFAPLGSMTFSERMTHHPELDPASLPDSIVLELEDGTILTRSAAALEIASRLGGFWRLLALIGSRLPSRLLDAGYDAIARVRKRLFATPKDACPILPPELRARFDP